MQQMFYGNGSFNSDISGWDVSSVTWFTDFMSTSGSFDMDFNQDLSTWNTTSAIYMIGMFKYCSSFNSDLSNWDVSNVTNMDGMFLDCQSFTADLSGWCVTNIPSLPAGYYTTPLTFTLPVWGTCPP
jgi:surface protein